MPRPRSDVDPDPPEADDAYVEAIEDDGEHDLPERDAYHGLKAMVAAGRLPVEVLEEIKAADDHEVATLERELRRALQVEDAEWNEADHPRHGAGSSQGGEFAPAGSGGEKKLYPYADLSEAKLEAMYKKISEEGSRINREFIEGGRGHERPSEIKGKTDLLSQRYNEHAQRWVKIIAEQDRRKRFHGGGKPLPKQYRQSFHGR